MSIKYLVDNLWQYFTDNNIHFSKYQNGIFIWKNTGRFCGLSIYVKEDHVYMQDIETFVINEPIFENIKKLIDLYYTRGHGKYDDALDLIKLLNHGQIKSARKLLN